MNEFMETLEIQKQEQQSKSKYMKLIINSFKIIFIK